MVKNLTAVIIAVASLVAGAFISSSELRAFAANTIRSIDIVDGEVKTADLGAGSVTVSKLGANAVNSAKIVDGTILNADLAPGAVTSAKIADGTVLAADIGTDAVGAAEIAGVSKLIFAECTNSNIVSMTAGSSSNFICSIAGLGTGDNVVATFQGNGCIDLRIGPILTAGQLQIGLKNECASTVSPGTVLVSVIVYA